MKLGFVFPGQGAQYKGMGKDLYDNYVTVRDVYKRVSNILNIDVAKLTFESSEEELNQTKNTQICILTMSLAILELLKQNGIEANISAGLSLGEYTALIYSNIFNFEEGVRIVRKRGELMQDNVPQGDWSMAAVIGLCDDVVENICSKINEEKFIVPANYNCPGQIVVSGEKEAILMLIEKANLLGAKRVIELKTSGPFHTEKLNNAAIKLKEELDKIKINSNFNKQVIKNIDATVYKNEDDIKDILSNHVIKPVRFSDSINEMIKLGVDTFIEIGPGKVLSGFIKKINSEVNVLNIFDVNSLINVLKFREDGIL
jgi:[acyl-carrier-protein] S-malonyltransferase